MGRIWRVLLAGLVMLAALAAVLLPLRKQLWETRSRRQSMELLTQRMEQLSDAEREMQRKLGRWYNFQVEQGIRVSRDAYESVMNLGGGQMGILEVPQLELMVPITHGIGGQAGHDSGTALPLGGVGEQTVLYLTEHRYWQEGMGLFTELPGCRMSWKVISVQVMPKGWPTDATPGKNMLTLVYDRGNTRTLIRCEPGVENVEKECAYGWILWIPGLILALCGLWKREENRFKGWKKKENISENQRKTGSAMILRL